MSVSSSTFHKPPPNAPAAEPELNEERVKTINAIRKRASDDCFAILNLLWAIPLAFFTVHKGGQIPEGSLDRAFFRTQFGTTFAVSALVITAIIIQLLQAAPEVDENLLDLTEQRKVRKVERKHFFFKWIAFFSMVCPIGHLIKESFSAKFDRSLTGWQKVYIVGAPILILMSAFPLGWAKYYQDKMDLIIGQKKDIAKT